MEPKVFCLLLEVAPDAGCELDPSEVAGAALRCYVLAADTERAEARTRAALETDHFRVIEVQWCVAVDGLENPDAPDQQHFEQAARSNPDDVVYGEFHTWGHDAEAD